MREIIDQSFIYNIPENEPWEKIRLSRSKPTALCKHIVYSINDYSEKHSQ
jgi:hypothetical protein